MSAPVWLRVAVCAVASMSAVAHAQTKAAPASPPSAPAAPAAATPTPTPARAATPAPAPAPAAPAAPAVASASAPAAATPAPDKSGVVLVEQAGRVAALGIVLNGDGRVLTAMSRITPGQLLVRYASGALEQVRIGHSDASRDLALLVPKTARNQNGLKAAEGPMPQGSAKLTSFSLAANRTLNAIAQTTQGMSEVNGHPVLKLATSPKPNELGGPLIDERGDAAAIIVSGCATGSTGCTAAPVALPVSEVRAFLRTRPASSGFQLPRLGIAGRAADTGVVRGLSITSVEAQSPAAALGLIANENPEAADVLVAVAGSPVVTEDGLRAVLARYAPNEKLDLLIFSKGSYRTASVRLGAPTQPVPTAPSAPVAPASAKPPAAPSAPSAATPPAAPKAPVAPAPVPKTPTAPAPAPQQSK